MQGLRFPPWPCSAGVQHVDSLVGSWLAFDRNSNSGTWAWPCSAGMQHVDSLVGSWLAFDRNSNSGTWAWASSRTPCMVLRWLVLMWLELDPLSMATTMPAGSISEGCSVTSPPRFHSSRLLACRMLLSMVGCEAIQRLAILSLSSQHASPVPRARRRASRASAGRGRRRHRQRLGTLSLSSQHTPRSTRARRRAPPRASATGRPIIS